MNCIVLIGRHKNNMLTLQKLIATKELKVSNARYTVPKPYFLVIALLPKDFHRNSIHSQLVR